MKVGLEMFLPRSKELPLDLLNSGAQASFFFCLPRSLSTSLYPFLPSSFKSCLRLLPCTSCPVRVKATGRAENTRPNSLVFKRKRGSFSSEPRIEEGFPPLFLTSLMQKHGLFVHEREGGKPVTTTL